MKKLVLSFATFIACCIFLAACEKNQLRVADFDLVAGAARLKVNLALPYLRNTGMQIKINDVRVSQLLFNSSTNYSNPYPGGGLNTLGQSFGDYLRVAPGAVKVGISFAKAGTNEDSAAIYSTTINLEADKVYTIHLTDTSTNIQNVLTTDNQATPDSGFTRYTFINLIPNLAAVDLYFGTSIVAANIPYKGVSPTFTVAAPTVYAFALRPAGALATSTAIATYVTGSVPDRRVMNIFSRGYNGLLAADIRRPQLSLVYVR